MNLDSGIYSSPPILFESITCNTTIIPTMTPKYAFLVATVTFEPTFILSAYSSWVSLKAVLWHNLIII